MKSFIEHIVEDLDLDELDSFKDYCYVFPSRRAGIYFQDLLRKRFAHKPIISPQIYSIEDFVIESIGKPVTDEITLVFDLYKCYKQFEKSLELEKFFAWGQILLSDFEELDRYMANADEVYSGLKEITDLNLVFGDSEEVKQAIKEFQKIFSNRETLLVNRFIHNWIVIRKTYAAFNELLEKEGKIYKGRAFRELAEQLVSEEKELPYKKIVFAGFNALSTSEELIITSLLKQGIAQVYFDCDSLYMSDPKEEAGDFLRNYKKLWNYEGIHWIETDLLNSENNIEFVGCTQMVGQAKVTGTILKDLIHSEEDLKNTAVVLADENLLMPVLHALPENVNGVNVTMGYPFRNTTLFSFISRIFSINIARRQSKVSTVYPTEEVLGILKNTLVSPVFPAQSRKLAKYIRDNRTRWISAGQIKQELGDSWLWLVFEPAKDGIALLDNITTFLVKIFNYLKENEADPSDREIIYHGLKHLSIFIDNLQSQDFKPEIGFVQKLFQESFRSIKIPFEGEPLDGMQIMGFLESRALDFKNVVILGVNETKLPANRMGQTYLPYAVRKAFQIPTFEEQEAIYAYHFKRLLQRSPNAYVLFNTEVAVDGSGEKSRFILQLQYSLDQKALKSGMAPGLKLTHRIIRNPMDSLDNIPTSITIEKLPDVMGIIKDRWTNADATKRKRLSPTALINYIDCKLRFYLKYVARVPEEELIMDDIDPRVFGTIVHRVIEILYKPYIDVPLKKSDIRLLAKDETIKGILNTVLEQEKIISKGDSLQGKDILVASVIQRLVRKIIILDEQIAPFEMKGVEDEIISEMTLSSGEKVNLGGVVDRIDQIIQDDQEITRIIDYKTGKVDMVPDTKAAMEDPDEYLRYYFSDGKYKAGFQAYYYASLVNLKNPVLTLMAGIFSTRTINDGIRFLRKGKVIDSQILERYREKLKGLIEELLDPKVPFDQTEDLSKCRVCAYKSICRR